MLTTVTTAGEGYIYTLSKTIRRFSLVHGRTKNKTRSSATADGPRDALSAKNIVSDRNKLYDDKSTIGSQLIDLNSKQPRLVDCRRPICRCRQQARPSTTTTSSVDDAIDVPWRNFPSPEFGTVPEGSNLIFGDTQIYFKHGVEYVEGRLHAKNSSIRPVVSIQYRL